MAVLLTELEELVVCPFDVRGVKLFSMPVLLTPLENLEWYPVFSSLVNPFNGRKVALFSMVDFVIPVENLEECPKLLPAPETGIDILLDNL